jgi:hypothetical protein
MRGATKMAALLLVATLAGGCASTGQGTLYPAAGPMPEGTRGAKVVPKSTGMKILDGALSVPETVVWWPYKIVGGAIHGIGDGVSGGVKDAPMPFLGVLASPLTGVWGGVKGLARGATLEPFYVGTTEEFGSALAKPFKK